MDRANMPRKECAHETTAIDRIQLTNAVESGLDGKMVCGANSLFVRPSIVSPRLVTLLYL